MGLTLYWLTHTVPASSAFETRMHWLASSGTARQHSHLVFRCQRRTRRTRVEAGAKPVRSGVREFDGIFLCGEFANREHGTEDLRS